MWFTRDCLGRSWSRSFWLLLLVSTLGLHSSRALAGPLVESPDVKFWLENMMWHHGYSVDESAAGLETSVDKVRQLMREFNIAPENRPADKPGGKTKVLPWAPGRHPRIGFREGAINPQRDAKISIFLPWKDSGFVVFDLPEAVFTDLGLTYLAHTHVATIWTEKGVTLPQIDWKRNEDGTLETNRTLPNGISFGAKVWPRANGADYEYWLRNGTKETLGKMRSQLCLMLKNAPEFNAQTKEDKLLLKDAAAVKSADGKRWIVTACEGTGRTWQNPPVPCIHADPNFPDCASGERVAVRGRVFFYEGGDVEGAIQKWREGKNY